MRKLNYFTLLLQTKSFFGKNRILHKGFNYVELVLRNSETVGYVSSLQSVQEWVKSDDRITRIMLILKIKLRNPRH